MKLGTWLCGTAILAATMALGCNRSRQEAVILANEGDGAVKVNVEGAINKYDQATKLDPNNHHIFYKLAQAYRKKEEWEKVASTLARATQLAPEYANYWFERGYALEQQAVKGIVSWDEPKEPYQKCIEADPNFSDCYHQLANAYLWSDDEQKALENYTKAIEHNPEALHYYASLADLYIRLDLITEAEQVLKEGKTYAKPGDPLLFGIHVLLSQVHQDRKQMNEMVTELEAAKAVAGADGPEAVQILYSLGSTYAKLEPPRKQEAIQMLKGFHTRACKGSKAKDFKSECETTNTLVTQLGGTLQ